MPDQTSEITQEFINLKIHEIKIIGKDNQVYEIYPNSPNFGYHSMTITEGMFEASLHGSLSLRDVNSTSEQINFSAFDDIVIKMENPEIPNSFKSLRFKIYNVKAHGDQIKENLIKEESNIPKIRLQVDFVSYEHYLLTYKEFSELAGLTGADIITKISTSSLGSSGKVGLVNSINDRFFKTGKTNSDTTQKPMFIEESRNWVWYKQNQSMYPWGKLNRPLKAAQLLQFLAEYAVSDSNPYACNFMFWQDMDRWNFRSIESLLREPVVRQYFVSNIPTQVGNIYSLKIVNESNFLRLFESNAFAAKYYLVEPKWNQPYREYLDYNESHSITEVVYNYFRDYNKWLKVEKYPLLPSGITTEPTAANIINDNVSGYFSKSFNNRDKTVAWDHHGYTFSNREGTITWQPMFDQVDLDGEVCRKIQKDIKQKLKDKRIEYANKKNLKEKWKVYKCSICCDPSSLEAEGTEVFSSEYGIVAAGAFTDLVNYNKSEGFSGSRQFPIGLTFSYDLSQEPFNKTIGNLMYLREVPDIQTKYLYDLELKRIDIARERLEKQIQYLESARQNALEKPVCEEDESTQPWEYCDNANSALNPLQTCFCTQEKKDEYIEIYYNAIIRNRQELLASDYFTKMKDIIEEEKTNFSTIYEQYKGRTAFFVSSELGFTADNSEQNLFNVKSITRVPIRGSKYEKLAKKKVLEEFAKNSGITFAFKGFSPGVTYYYPYEVFYNNDSSIDPSIKHPHYDAGYNFDLGFGANPHFSVFDEIGGPNSGSPLGNDPHFSLLYYVSVRAKIVTKVIEKTAILLNPNYGCEPSNVQIGGYSTEVTDFFNYTYTDSNPEKLSQPEIVKRILREKIIGELFSYEIEYTTNGALLKRTSPDVCGNPNERTIEIVIEYDQVYSNNLGNSYLSQFDLSNPTAICVHTPFGLERLDFDPIEYLNSRNLMDLREPEEGEEPKRPIEKILEEIESFVRVEFQTPIGVNTVYDFPKGFYDTPGSEYYLPYHVFLNAGPFGTKSVDYNISVLGQDPYGFDVAVKRINKKKQELKPENKALVNNKDYHIVENGYLKNTSLDLFYNWQQQPITYGFSPKISYNSVPNPYNYSKRSDTYLNFGLNKLDSDEHRIRQTDFTYGDYIGTNLSEIFYHDLLKNITRKNPLSLPNSYFEFNNSRLDGTAISANSRWRQQISLSQFGEGDYTKQNESFSTTSGSNETYGFKNIGISNEQLLSDLLLPGNVFGYYQPKENSPLPIPTDYFKSFTSYNPSENGKNGWLSFFELDLRNRNTREDKDTPEQETTFYGNYYGVAIWNHPQLPDDLSCVWKNDISGETEYGLIGPELDSEDSTFDRNFAAQFMVISRQTPENNPCKDYPCSNPEPVDNSTCPDNDPICNCPCQELRPDKMTVGFTGPEPTYAELRQLEQEIKECDLIESVLGEDWLGCVWGKPNDPLNCNCPCIGTKFLDYLKYSQTYCTFWQTPPERPLLRNAQMMQINANKIVISLNGDFTLRPGTKISLNLGTKRYSGTWLVQSIVHDIAKTKHYMDVVLIRDTEYLNPNIRAEKLVLNN